MLDAEKLLYGMKVGEITGVTTAKAFVNSFKIGVKLIPILSLVSTGMALMTGFQVYQKLHPDNDQTQSLPSSSVNENKSVTNNSGEPINPITNLPIEYQKLIKIFPDEYAQLLKDIQNANGNSSQIQELIEDWGDKLLEKIETEKLKK